MKGYNKYWFLCEDTRNNSTSTRTGAIFNQRNFYIEVEATSPEQAREQISKLIYYNIVIRCLERPEGMVYSLNQLEQNIINTYNKPENEQSE